MTPTSWKMTQSPHVKPDYIRKTEEQVFARVSRIGQRKHKTVAYRIICPDVQVEGYDLGAATSTRFIMLRVSSIITHPCSEPRNQWHNFCTMYDHHSKGDLDTEGMISFWALTKTLGKHV